MRIGVPYEQRFFAVDAVGQTTPWRISDGHLPPGLQFQNDGPYRFKIFGTPTVGGRFSATLEVRDQYPQAATLTRIFDVADNVVLTTNSTSAGRTGLAYTFSFSATSGVLPYHWSVTDPPSGLNLDPSTGLLAGVPISRGFFTFRVTVTDSSNPAQSDSRFFSIRVDDPLQLLDTMPKAHPDYPYCEQVPWSGGGSTRQLQLVSGALPPGLDFGFNDSICGTPTQVGNFPLTFRVQESDPFPVTITKTIDFVVDESVFVVKPQLNDAWQDQSFSYSFTAVNGVPPYHWSETGLPGALALDPDTGQLSGIPTAAGTSKYNITVTDSSIPALSDTRAVTIGVRDRLEFAGVLRPLLLRDGRNFDESIPLRGGSGNYVWTLVSGQLPPGISLTQQGGFRGVATQAGSYPIRVEVRDFSPGPYVVQGDFTITVIPPPLGLNTFPLLLAPATRGAPYHSQLGPAVDGVAPYQWSISAGQVPPGLVLDQATGAIDGVPTQVGRFPFQVLVRDSDTPAQSISRWSAIEVRSSLGRNDSIQTATSIGNFGTEASISPFLDPVTSSLPNPDQDYYRIMAIGGTAARVRVSPREQLDSVLELFNENGQRLQSCGPPSYTSSCLNDDSIGDGGNITLGSTLDFAVPGAPGSPTTFYARVFDWRGNARPDMLYTLSVLGAIDPLKIEQSSLGPGGIRGVNYRKQLTSNGGKGSVTWSLAAGAVPPVGQSVAGAC